MRAVSILPQVQECSRRHYAHAQQVANLDAVGVRAKPIGSESITATFAIRRRNTLRSSARAFAVIRTRARSTLAPSYDLVDSFETAERAAPFAARRSSLPAAAARPRWPISIDPETRDIVQNIYMRRVQKVEGELHKVEFETFPNVKDPAKAKK